MQRAFSATTEATPEALFDVVGDIRTYPHWLDVVSDVAPADQADAWLVTLKARVGPFARSKRLRMVRTVHEPAKNGQPASVRFERQEVDGREHSDWVLAARVNPVGETEGGSEVTLDLSYDGTMWSGLLDGVLGAAANRAVSQLQAYVRP